MKFSIIKRLKSFNYAFSGMVTMLAEEHNARIHLIATFFTILLSIGFNISGYEWALILFAIGLVFCLEIINTIIENLADIISPDKNEKIKKIKDMSAAAVLLAAFIALVIGIIIFTPKIYIYVNSL